MIGEDHWGLEGEEEREREGEREGRRGREREGEKESKEKRKRRDEEYKGIHTHVQCISLDNDNRHVHYTQRMSHMRQPITNNALPNNNTK